jgi:co-chaperonin GroES (HSP10)
LKKYVALEDNVFIREKKPELKTASGFIMPEGTSNDFSYGTVVSAGFGTFEHGNFVPMSVQVGDEVLFPRTIMNKVTFPDGDTLIIMKASDILAKLEEVDIEEEKAEEK